MRARPAAGKLFRASRPSHLADPEPAPGPRRGFGIRSLAVFGSVARNEASTTSDVDILVEFDGSTTFDRFFGLKDALEEILGTHVDLATPAMLKPRLKLEVDREGVRVA